MEIYKNKNDMGGKSSFWPILLVGVGVLWLLSNLNIISPPNLNWLWRLWPLLLIAIGLNLLFGRRSSAVSTVIGIVVAAVVVIVVAGPALGWVSAPEVKSEQFRAPLEDATNANVTLSTGIAALNVSPLNDSNQLIDANLTTIGDVAFNVEGDSTRNVRLEQQDSQKWWNPFAWSAPEQELRWDVGLSTDVPLDLDIHTGIGSAELDLNGLQVRSLDIESGVGTINVNLPALDTVYEADISSGVGSVNIAIADYAALKLDIDAGTGSVSIDVPDDAAVRVEGKAGLGGIQLSSGFQRVQGDDESLVGDSGVWETANFDEARRQIFIDFEGGVGSLNIH